MTETRSAEARFVYAVGAVGGIVGASAMIALVLAVLVVPSLIFNAWALSVLWGWFVVGWWGVPSMPIFVGVGLLLAFHIIQGTVQGLPKQSDDWKDTWKGKTPGIICMTVFMLAFGRAIMSLGAGWMALQVMRFIQ